MLPVLVRMAMLRLVSMLVLVQIVGVATGSFKDNVIVVGAAGYSR